MFRSFFRVINVLNSETALRICCRLFLVNFDIKNRSIFIRKLACLGKAERSDGAESPGKTEGVKKAKTSSNLSKYHKLVR